MSIVVTCSCTKTYRLPNRYAGKRCRCRDCGRKIAVPPTAAESAVEEPAKAEKRGRRRKRKDDPSRTTRRLSSQDQEILGERRRLRSSQRARPVSESMHQLAPMTLSGELSIAPAQPKKAMPRRAAAAEKPAEAKPSKPSKSKSKPKKAPRPSAPSAKAPVAKPSKTKVSPKQPEPGSEIEVPAPRKVTKGKKAAVADKGARKKDKKKDTKGKKAQGRRGHASREDDEDARPAARTRKRAYNLPVVLGIAGVLCLGIGLVIGGLLSAGSSKGADPAIEQRLAHVDGLKASRQWAAAKAALDALQTELKTAGDDQGAARVRAAAIAVDTMAQLAAIEDDETKLATLVDYSTNADAAVRLGVAFELRELAELEDAQDALAALATDTDKRVAEAARHGLVHGGGPRAIPYLGEVIEQTAGSGHKLGDVALERALEIQEPEIAPVLLIALKARASAPAPVLKAILGRLAEFADPSMKDAVTPFASHADEGVKAAAQNVLDSIG